MSCSRIAPCPLLRLGFLLPQICVILTSETCKIPLFQEKKITKMTELKFLRGENYPSLLGCVVHTIIRVSIGERQASFVCRRQKWGKHSDHGGRWRSILEAKKGRLTTSGSRIGREFSFLVDSQASTAFPIPWLQPQKTDLRLPNSES